MSLKSELYGLWMAICLTDSDCVCLWVVSPVIRSEASHWSDLPVSASDWLMLADAGVRLFVSRGKVSEQMCVHIPLSTDKWPASEPHMLAPSARSSSGPRRIRRREKLALCTKMKCQFRNTTVDKGSDASTPKLSFPVLARQPFIKLVPWFYKSSVPFLILCEEQFLPASYSPGLRGGDLLPSELECAIQAVCIKAAWFLSHCNRG